MAAEVPWIFPKYPYHMKDCGRSDCFVYFLLRVVVLTWKTFKVYLVGIHSVYCLKIVANRKPENFTPAQKIKEILVGMRQMFVSRSKIRFYFRSPISSSPSVTFDQNYAGVILGRIRYIDCCFRATIRIQNHSQCPAFQIQISQF